MITSPLRGPCRGPGPGYRCGGAGCPAAGRVESAAVAEKLALAYQVGGEAYQEPAACEVGAALSVSSLAAKNLVHLRDVLANRLPRVRADLEQGLLDPMRVRVIIDRTQAITDPSLLAEAERRILAQVLVPGRCVIRGQTQHAADEVVAALDPASVIARRTRAVAERCLDVRADLRGMSSVYRALPAADGAVVDRALRVMALGVCGADPRTLDQRRADALTAWAAGHTSLPCACGSPDTPNTRDTTSHRRPRPAPTKTGTAPGDRPRRRPTRAGPTRRPPTRPVHPRRALG